MTARDDDYSLMKQHFQYTRGLFTSQPQVRGKYNNNNNSDNHANREHVMTVQFTHKRGVEEGCLYLFEIMFKVQDDA